MLTMSLRVWYYNNRQRDKTTNKKRGFKMARYTFIDNFTNEIIYNKLDEHITQFVVDEYSTHANNTLDELFWLKDIFAKHNMTVEVTIAHDQIMSDVIIEDLTIREVTDIIATMIKEEIHFNCENNVLENVIEITTRDTWYKLYLV